MRNLLKSLNLERNEKITWESKEKEKELAGYFFDNKHDGKDDKMKKEEL